MNEFEVFLSLLRKTCYRPLLIVSTTQMAVNIMVLTALFLSWLSTQKRFQNIFQLGQMGHVRHSYSWFGFYISVALLINSYDVGLMLMVLNKSYVPGPRFLVFNFLKFLIAMPYLTLYWYGVFNYGKIYYQVVNGLFIRCSSPVSVE